MWRVFIDAIYHLFCSNLKLQNQNCNINAFVCWTRQLKPRGKASQATKKIVFPPNFRTYLTAATDSTLESHMILKEPFKKIYHMRYQWYLDEVSVILLHLGRLVASQSHIILRQNTRLVTVFGRNRGGFVVIFPIYYFYFFPIFFDRIKISGEEY